MGGRHFAHRGGRHERLGQPRQRVRVPRDERTVAASGDGHPGARVVQRQEPDQRRPQGILRIPLNSDGAVGRSCRAPVQRRPLRGWNVGSQRPSPEPLHHHQGRHDGRGQRGRCDGLRAGRRGQQGTSAAGQDPAHRHAGGPHLLRRRNQGAAGQGAPLPRVALDQPHPAREVEERPPREQCRR